MKIKRRGSAVWQGGLKDGKGAISTESGALNACPYGFASRFEGQRGSNPEELIGAAHAACFSMALSLILARRSSPPSKLIPRRKSSWSRSREALPSPPCT